MSKCICSCGEEVSEYYIDDHYKCNYFYIFDELTNEIYYVYLKVNKNSLLLFSYYDNNIRYFYDLESDTEAYKIIYEHDLEKDSNLKTIINYLKIIKENIIFI